MSAPLDFIVPDWPAPPRVHALQSTRLGGVSRAPYDSLNFGMHVGDDPYAVATNRQRLNAHVPSEPVWLEQVHGTEVIIADMASCAPRGDAAIARHTHSVCAIMTADCLPVFLCDEAGSVVGLAHAGWRGLAEGVIEATVKAMQVPGGRLMAWLGPAIGPQAFEVGAEVRATFVGHDPASAVAFAPHGDKYLADIYALARLRLAAQGVTQVWGGDLCTYSDPQRFYSYRRDGRTGRMVSLIWLSQA